MHMIPTHFYVDFIFTIGPALIPMQDCATWLADKIDSASK